MNQILIKYCSCTPVVLVVMAFAWDAPPLVGVRQRHEMPSRFSRDLLATCRNDSLWFLGVLEDSLHNTIRTRGHY